MTPTIFEGEHNVIPLANVLYVEKNGDSEICVVLKGAQHPSDSSGNYLSGYGRADCPYLHGEEKDKFLKAWRQHEDSLRRREQSNVILRRR